MQNNLAQIIVYGLSEKLLFENMELNRQIIDNVVENWDREVYIVPSQALKVNREFIGQNKRFLM